MLDNTKFRTSNKTVISKLLLHPNFTPKTSRNNRIAKFNHKTIGTKLRIELCKEFNRGQFTGYEFADISISPHYHFNQYRHNGNDFTPTDCIKTIIEILTYLGITPQEFEELKVCNIEYGLNIIPETDIKSLIDGLLLYKTARFIVPDKKKKPYYKESDTSKEKSIKAYAKGIHCHDVLSAPEIDYNTFRFEVKHKKSRPTRLVLKKKNVTATDLLNLETYKTFSQALIQEWQQVLILHSINDLKGLKFEEKEIVKNAKSIDYWLQLNRTEFGRKKKKYRSIFGLENNLHVQITELISQKINTFSNVTFSPQKTTTNKEKIKFTDYVSKLIKCENATATTKIKVCLVTGLDISMQKKGSKYLCFAGLKYYRENKIEIYRDLEKKYLTDKMRVQTIEKQMYYIAHNIRNRNTNQNHNPRYSRKRFEERNYHKNQLQLFD